MSLELRTTDRVGKSESNERLIFLVGVFSLHLVKIRTLLSDAPNTIKLLTDMLYNTKNLFIIQERALISDE